MLRNMCLRRPQSRHTCIIKSIISSYHCLCKHIFIKTYKHFIITLWSHAFPFLSVLDHSMVCLMHWSHSSRVGTLHMSSSGTLAIDAFFTISANRCVLRTWSTSFFAESPSAIEILAWQTPHSWRRLWSLLTFALELFIIVESKMRVDKFKKCLIQFFMWTYTRTKNTRIVDYKNQLTRRI